MSIRLMTIDDYEKVYELWMSCVGMGLNSVCSMIKQFQSVHYPDFSTRISDKKLQTK